MTSWAEINLQLLIQDRCSHILSKALHILDGLTSYYIEILGMPTWPSVPLEHTTLFILKVYLSGRIVDISELTEFLNLTSEYMLLTGAKILLNTVSDDKAINLVNSFLLSDIDMDDEYQHIIIREILVNFNQILHVTTISIWDHHKEKTIQTTASLNLKSKMMAKEATSASEATALALTKATEAINNE
jgi:hypothetical protein